KISVRDFFLDPARCAEAWRASAAILREDFGDLIPPRKPSPAPLSYGHLACLGAPVTIPDHGDGEPNITPFADSIDEGIRILRDAKGMDYAKHELYRHYVEVWEHLKAAFPEEDIPFSGMGVEGPLTSAGLMRGQGFFMDIYDEPEKSVTFLTLMVDSAVEFIKQTRRTNGQAPMQPSGGIADEFASLIPPALWPEMVIPMLNRQYEGTTNGPGRSLHLENLSPRHLPFLSQLRLTHFQPSVSNLLTLENVKANLDPAIPFDWLLYAYRVTEMSDSEISDWVDEAARAGVQKIRTQFGAYAYMAGKTDRIKAFVAAFDKYRAR
nr:uroporphyrinogen decarboxylase family protein [Clostridia bacterium]